MLRSVCAVAILICALASTLTNGDPHSFKRVCYYTNWSQYRSGTAQFLPKDIDPTLCSHIMYAFASMDGNKLVAFEWNDESTPYSTGKYDEVLNLRNDNPSLKVLLAVGGWTFGVVKMKNMLATRASRAEFVRTTITYLRSKGFDGLDLDFEYPGARGSPAEDKKRFTLLCKELREEFAAEALTDGREVLLLTAAVAAGKENIDRGYEVEELTGYLDFISLMSYDMHGAWQRTTGHNSPLLPKTGAGVVDELNMKWAAEYWISLGVPKKKLVIGMALYGRGYTLASAAPHKVGTSSMGPSRMGTYTKQGGLLAYYEVCQKLSLEKTVKIWDGDQKVPYIQTGDQFIGYDDPRSLALKVSWLKERDFGGWMVWALDYDDFTGQFCDDGTYPLLRRLNSALLDDTTDATPTRTTITTTTITTTTTTSTTTTNATTSPKTRATSTTTKKTTSPTTTTTATTTTKATRPTTTPTTTTITTTTPTTTTTATTRRTKFTCKGKKTGIHTDPANCSMFYYCVWGYKYHMHCAPGTWFDPKLSICNWPYNVDREC